MENYTSYKVESRECDSCKIREIKFRAWDTVEKAMIPWQNALDLNVVLRDTRFIPQQFTGLKDKNGQEIYERDIYLAEWDGAQPLEVYWDEYLGGFVDGSGDHVGEKAKVAEVIGNIWEDGGLLEQSNC